MENNMIDMFGNKIDASSELESLRGNQEALGKYFPNQEKCYAEVEVGSYHIVRQVHGTTGEIVYAVYSPESYRKYKLWEKRKH